MPSISAVLKKYQSTFHPVIKLKQGEKISALDLSAENTALTEDVFTDTFSFTQFIENERRNTNAAYLAGGYGELRNIYGKSDLFSGEEPRRLHLGIDIWGNAGTPVYCFLGGMVHSFAFNDNDGDYGATLILLHQLDGIAFYTLYGHISLRDIDSIAPGQYVSHGQQIAHFGEPHENGNWPPHLHFQVIADMELKKGDYPGVCKFSEREKYLKNCPDPNLILQMGDAEC